MVVALMDNYFFAGVRKFECITHSLERGKSGPQTKQLCTIPPSGDIFHILTDS